MQQWSALADETLEDALHDSQGAAHFRRPRLGSEVVPDATVEAALPFSLLSFDRDNGGEFLNCHLWHPELRARQTEIDPLALVKDKQRRLREIFAMARRVIPASETH